MVVLSPLCLTVECLDISSEFHIHNDTAVLKDYKLYLFTTYVRLLSKLTEKIRLCHVYVSFILSDSWKICLNLKTIAAIMHHNKCLRHKHIFLTLQKQASCEKMKQVQFVFQWFLLVLTPVFGRGRDFTYL